MQAEIDSRRFEVTVAGKQIGFTPKEFNIFKTLALADGMVISRDELRKVAWGSKVKTDYDSRAIDQHVARIRKTLGKNRDLIQTVSLAGYKAQRGIKVI